MPRTRMEHPVPSAPCFQKYVLLLLEMDVGSRRAAEQAQAYAYGKILDVYLE
jgi:hypothetical protein